MKIRRDWNDERRMLMRLLLDPVELSKTGDMDTETLRRYGHQIVDWLVVYLDGIVDYPVLSRVIPRDIQRCIPGQAPQRPEAMDAILADIHRLVIPGITHWNAGSFMGYFGLTSSGPSILAEMFDATFNVTRMLWRTSPPATELERFTLRWLRQMLGLPASLFGMLHPHSPIPH